MTDWSKIGENWKMISGGITAVLVAAASIFGGVDIAVDNTREELELQVQANTELIEIVANAVERIQNDQDLDRWQYLNKKRKAIGLTLAEYQEFCALGAKLFEGYTCPPNKNGEDHD